MDNIDISRRFANGNIITKFVEAVWNGVHRVKVVALRRRD
jgi:hypothetical protein